MKKLAILLTMILLCGCRAGGVPETPEPPDTSETATVTTITAAETTSETVTVATAETVDGGVFILPDMTLYSGRGIPWSELYVYEPFPILIDVPKELREGIDAEEWENWSDTLSDVAWPYDSANPETIPTRLTQSVNFYTFLSKFKDRFTDEEITNAFKNEANYMNETMYSDFPYEITDKQLNAVLSMDEERVLNAFISDFSIAKGVYYYTPKWLYYHSVDDYEKAGLTPDEILKSLNKCRDIYYLQDTFIDVAEYNLYFYAVKLGSDLTVTDICGYDRDMTMPLPLGKGDIYKQQAFKSDETDSVIAKNGVKYTMSWVYHNKPAAYKKAGITPTELVAMLPRYKALGILTDEAYAALERKINEYGEEL